MRLHCGYTVLSHSSTHHMTWGVCDFNSEQQGKHTEEGSHPDRLNWALLRLMLVTFSFCFPSSWWSWWCRVPEGFPALAWFAGIPFTSWHCISLFPLKTHFQYIHRDGTPFILTQAQSECVDEYKLIHMDHTVPRFLGDRSRSDSEGNGPRWREQSCVSFLSPSLVSRLSFVEVVGH